MWNRIASWNDLLQLIILLPWESTALISNTSGASVKYNSLVFDTTVSAAIWSNVTTHLKVLSLFMSSAITMATVLMLTIPVAVTVSFFEHFKNGSSSIGINFTASGRVVFLE